MIKKEFELFLNENNPSVTDKTSRYMTRKNNSLGMIKINNFCWSVRMSWLRRLTFSNSTWANLNRQETKTFTFNPTTSTLDDLEKARHKTSNLVWRDIHDSLMICRRNIVYSQPSEYLSVPVNGEPSLAKNFISVNQFWCRTLMIKDVLNNQGDWKSVKVYIHGQRPLFYKLTSVLCY